MATQLDSVQISQLKALALGLECDSADLDVSCIRTAAENYIIAANALSRYDSPSKSKPNPTLLRPSSNPDLAAHFSHSQSSTNPLQPFCVSAPELPSTVPDSHSPKREMSQSEGDTQPISQRIIEEFRAKSNLEYAERFLPSTCDGTVETACETHESSVCTCVKGQPGYVDLLAGFEQPFRTEREEHLLENNDEMDPLSPVATVRAELYPESKRFQQPKTPATSGKKRSENGDSLPRGDSNPRLPLNPFADRMMSLGALMDASQAFRATQAASSPLGNALPSDAISERPSPHIYELQRPATTGPSSSPRPARSFMTRAVTEPQAKYVSIKESQEKREQLAQRSLELNVSVVVSSDEDFESDDSQLRRRRNQRKIDLKTKGQLCGITAPPRPVSSGRGRGRTRGGFGGNEHNGRTSIEASKAVITADELAPDEIATEDETEHEEETEIIFGELERPGDDDKENVDVPMTISRLKKTKTPATQFPSSPSRPLVNVASSAEQFQFLSRRRESFESLKKSATMPDGTQTTAIADSQPSLDSDQVWPQPRKVRDYPRSSPPLEADDSISPEPPPRPASQAESVGIKSATASQGGFEHKSLPTPCVSSSPAPTSKTHSEPPTDQIGTSTITTATAPKSSHSAENHSTQLPHSSMSIPNRTEVIGLNGHESSKSSKASHSGATIAIVESSHSDNEVAKVGNSPMDGYMKRATTQSSPLKLSKIQNMAPQKISKTNDSRPQSNSANFSAATPTSHMKANFLSKTPPDSLTAQASNGSTRFETAQTTLLHSPHKPFSHRQLVVSSNQNLATASPPHKSLAQILADPSPPDVIEQPSVDINLLTGEDMEILNALHGSSPVESGSGRRRGNAGQVLGFQREHDRSCSPVTYRTSDEEGALGAPQPKANIASAATARQIASRDRVSGTVGRDSKKASPSKDQFPHVERAVKVVQPKAGKISIPSAARSLQDNDFNQDTLTGDELAMDYSTCGRDWGKGVGRSNRLYGNSPKKLSEDLNSTSDPGVRSRKIKPLPKPKAKQKPQKVPSENKKGGTALTRSTSPSKSVRTPATLDTANLQHSFVAPDRVFAHFNGRLVSAYYPATCIAGLAGELPRYRIRFDDGQDIEIWGSGIKRLELRKGDTVKIENRKGEYLVQGFTDQQLPTVEDLGTPSKAAAHKAKILPMYTDVFGHATVILVDKKHQSVSEKDAVPLSIAIRDIYVSQRMWSSFQGRPYVPTFPSSFRLETPSDTPSAPYTPSSRSCRTKDSFLANPRSFNTSTTQRRGIFANTVFATTHIEGDGARKQLENQIVSNGGRLLGDGFDELFNIPPLELASASKKNPLNSLFRPTQTAQTLGFTCLIAASHNRKPKYIQALSLGIPCLATRWVYDCISKQCLIPWQPYLLAAGDSHFLAGAAHSRILPAYDPNMATVTKIVGNRPKLLEGESVLMILRPKEEEEMKFFTLIMHALGARIVAKASSLDDASRALVKHPPKDGTPSWDRVWISEHEAKAENYLFGRNTTTISVGKKRKRGGPGYSIPAPTPTARGVILEGGKKRVIGNEYVIQSLILGQLVEGD